MKISGKRVKTNLSQERLRKLFNYNPDSGLFFRRKKTTGCRFHLPAGNNNHGYIRMQVDGVSYQAHRLAWLYVYGYWPQCDLDHINNERNDNRITNLRLASRSQNLANSRTKRNGLKGVYFHKKSQTWHARIQINYHKISLGYYDTEQEAHHAYCIAAQKYHGQFARAA